MARNNVRVKIPRNTGEMLSLATLIYQKHKSLGAASPLTGMEDYNWNDTAASLSKATALQAQVDDMRKQAEKLQKEIDAMSADVRGSVTGSRDVLLGINKKNPKKLGDYGFVVDDSPKAKKSAGGNA